MYPHQAERLTEALTRAGVEALVATTPANVRYLTGFRSPTQAAFPDSPAWAVFGRRGTALVLPAADAPAAAEGAPPADHVLAFGTLFLAGADRPDEAWRRAAAWTESLAPRAEEGLARALERLGVKGGSIGLDEGGLSPAAWRRVSERLQGARLVEASGALADARRVKGPWEIECMQKALVAAEESLNVLIQSLKPGVAEREMVSTVREELLRRGVEPARVLALVGERAAFPALEPSGRALRPGDLVRLEIAGALGGYRAILGRTAVAGEPNQRQQAAWDALQTGLEAAMDAVKPGVPASRIFDIAIEVTRRAGLAGYRRGHVGHGIGLEPYERPKLAPGVEAPLEAGMVLVPQALHLAPGWGGLALADTLLVGHTGGIRLNRSAQGLVVLD